MSQPALNVCMSAATHCHKGVNQRVGGHWKRHFVDAVLFGCSPSMSPPPLLPLGSTPILPLQWTCITFGAAGSRWRWHHLHCSALQHWVWTKTCQPPAKYLYCLLCPCASVSPCTSLWDHEDLGRLECGDLFHPWSALQTYTDQPFHTPCGDDTPNMFLSVVKLLICWFTNKLT